MGVHAVGVGSVFFEVGEVVDDLLEHFLVHRVLGRIGSLERGGRGGEY